MWNRGWAIIQEHTLCRCLQNKKEVFYVIIMEDSMITQAEKDRKKQKGWTIKEKNLES